MKISTSFSTLLVVIAVCMVQPTSQQINGIIFTLGVGCGPQMGQYILDDDHLIASCSNDAKRILEISPDKQSLTLTQSFTFAGRLADTVHFSTNTYLEHELYKLILSPTTAGPTSTLAGIPAGHTVSQQDCIQHTVYCYWLMEETATLERRLARADVTAATITIEAYQFLLAGEIKNCRTIHKNTPYFTCTSNRRVIIDTSYTTGNYEILENVTNLGSQNRDLANIEDADYVVIVDGTEYKQIQKYTLDVLLTRTFDSTFGRQIQEIKNSQYVISALRTGSIKVSRHDDLTLVSEYNGGNGSRLMHSRIVKNSRIYYHGIESANQVYLSRIPEIACEKGRYLVGDACMLCTSPCATCNASDTDCTSCVAGFGLDGNTCYTCPVGTYSSAGGGPCLACDPLCSSCSGSATNCQSCNAGASLHSPTDNCRTCPSGQYNDGTTCQPCQDPCTECQDMPLLCLSCLANFIFDFSSKSCLCPPEYFVNRAVTFTCEPCADPCHTCLNQATECTSCVTGQNLTIDIANRACVCASGSVLIGTTCEPCTPPCTTCTTDQTTCTGCTANYNLVVNSCQCPAPYTVVGAACDLVCDFPCETCLASPATPAHCLTCIPSTGMEISGTTCACPADHTFNVGNQTCELVCDANCATCVNTPTECTGCTLPLTLNTGNNTCELVCDPNCATCVNTPTECTGCTLPLTLNTGNDTCELVCDANCATCVNTPTECTGCTSPLTLNTGNNTCELVCDANCATCINTPTQCTGCTLPLTLNTGNDTCELVCDPNCATCVNTPTECTGCTLPLTLNTGNNTCELVCDANCATCQNQPTECTGCTLPLTLNTSNDTCELVCDVNCATCINTSTECTGCTPPLTLNTGSNTCELVCDTNCATCQNQPTECTGCTPPLTLNTGNDTCELICDSNCATCQNQPTECTSCTFPLSLNTVTNTCEFICDPNCMTCINLPTECTSCDSSLKLNPTNKKCESLCGCGMAQYKDFCEPCGCTPSEDNEECTCECEVEVLSHYLEQRTMDCEIENFCFELKFFNIRRPEYNIGHISFSEKNPRILSLHPSSNLQELTELEVQNTEGKIILKIEQTKSKELFKESKIYSKLSISPLYTSNTTNTVYFSDLEATAVTNIPTPLSQNEITRIETLKNIGEITGTVGSVGITLLEVAVIGASLASVDHSGTLVSYVLFIKTLVQFRYLNINFGNILEVFMEGLGRKLEVKSKDEHNSKILNQTGTKAKLSLYKRPITTFKHYHYKIVIYLISWILKITFKIVTRRAKKAQYIQKWAFYMIYYHQKLHFAVFNTFIASGVMITASTLLYMKINIDNKLLTLDYGLAALCTILYTIDFFDLFLTTVMFSTSYKSKEDFENEVKSLEENKNNTEKRIIRAYNYIHRDQSIVENSVAGLNKSLSPGIQKVKKLYFLIFQTPKKKEELPTMVPIAWIEPQIAEALNFKKQINYPLAISRIEWNQPFISFSLANINKKKPEYKNMMSIRLDGPFFRLRIAIFNILLIGLYEHPILGALLCLLTELGYLTFVLIAVFRYFYLQNWMIIASRINSSASIIFITFLAFILSLGQAGDDLNKVAVSNIVQYLGVVIILGCMLIETAILIIINFIKVISFVKGKFQKKKQVKDKNGVSQPSLMPLVWSSIDEQPPFNDNADKTPRRTIKRKEKKMKKNKKKLEKKEQLSNQKDSEDEPFIRDVVLYKPKDISTDNLKTVDFEPTRENFSTDFKRRLNRILDHPDTI